jgi:hypothetical protein
MYGNIKFNPNISSTNFGTVKSPLIIIGKLLEGSSGYTTQSKVISVDWICSSSLRTVQYLGRRVAAQKSFLSKGFKAAY